MDLCGDGYSDGPRCESGIVSMARLGRDSGGGGGPGSGNGEESMRSSDVLGAHSG